MLNRLFGAAASVPPALPQDVRPTYRRDMQKPAPGIGAVTQTLPLSPPGVMPRMAQLYLALYPA